MPTVNEAMLLGFALGIITAILITAIIIGFGILIDYLHRN